MTQVKNKTFVCFGIKTMRNMSPFTELLAFHCSALGNLQQCMYALPWSDCRIDYYAIEQEKRGGSKADICVFWQQEICFPSLSTAAHLGLASIILDPTSRKRSSCFFCCSPQKFGSMQPRSYFGCKVMNLVVQCPRVSLYWFSV